MSLPLEIQQLALPKGLQDLASLARVMVDECADNEWNRKLVALGYPKVPLAQAFYYVVGTNSLIKTQLRIILASGVAEHLDAFFIVHKTAHHLLLDDDLIEDLDTERLTPSVRALYKKAMQEDKIPDNPREVVEVLRGYDDVLAGIYIEHLTENGVTLSSLLAASNSDDLDGDLLEYTEQFLDCYDYPSIEDWCNTVLHRMLRTMLRTKVFTDPNCGWRQYNNTTECDLTWYAEQGFIAHSKIALTDYEYFRPFFYLCIHSHNIPAIISFITTYKTQFLAEKRQEMEPFFEDAIIYNPSEKETLTMLLEELK